MNTSNPYGAMQDNVERVQLQSLGMQMIGVVLKYAEELGSSTNYDTPYLAYDLLCDAGNIYVAWEGASRAEFEETINGVEIITDAAYDAVYHLIRNFEALHGKLLALKQPPLNSPAEDVQPAPLNATEFVTESGLYEMFLQGNSPQAQEFRKWVTEEVLPTIRTTGKYDHDQSTHSIPKGFFTPPLP